MAKLFVVGFPREMSEIELDQLFTIHAMVKKITIIRDMQTGVSKGYAFVDMLDQPGADRAISALNGFAIGERILSVRFADNKNEQASGSRPGFVNPNQSYANNSNLYEQRPDRAGRKRPRKQQSNG